MASKSVIQSKVRLWEVVDSYTEENRGMMIIRCPDCGYQYKIRATQYRNTRSCRRCRFVIQNKGNLGKHRGVGELSKTYYNYYKNNAKRRSVSFTVSIKELWRIALSQDMTCALSGLPIKFPTMRNINGQAHFGDLTFNEKQYVRVGSGNLLAASVDRIDSEKGYRKGNVQWVNKSINVMKNGFSQEEFIYYCHQVAKHNKCPKIGKLKGNRKKNIRKK